MTWPFIILRMFSFAILAGAILWGIYDQWKFTRHEGTANRGIRIKIKRMSEEAREYLETLPTLFEYEQQFIKKENNEVLITDERELLHWISGPGNDYDGRRGLVHIGYVNLSRPDNIVEIRTSFASLIVLLVVLVGFFTLFLSIAYTDNGDGTSWLEGSFILILITAIIGGRLFSNHLFECDRLLSILDQALRQSQRK